MDRMNTLVLLSGNVVDYDNPTGFEFELDDIVVPLCNNCRWAGQLPIGRWYSIAQHAVNTSLIVEPGYELDALMHDRSEGFTNDIVTPLKRKFPGIKDLENELEAYTAQVLGLQHPMPPQVKLADTQMLALEIVYLKKDDPKQYSAIADLEYEHLRSKIDLSSWTPEEAYARFMGRYKELTR